MYEAARLRKKPCSTINMTHLSLPQVLVHADWVQRAAARQVGGAGNVVGDAGSGRVRAGAAVGTEDTYFQPDADGADLPRSVKAVHNKLGVRNGSVIWQFADTSRPQLASRCTRSACNIPLQLRHWAALLALLGGLSPSRWRCPTSQRSCFPLLLLIRPMRHALACIWVNSVRRRSGLLFIIANNGYKVNRKEAATLSHSPLRPVCGCPCYSLGTEYRATERAGWGGRRWLCTRTKI